MTSCRSPIDVETMLDKNKHYQNVPFKKQFFFAEKHIQNLTFESMADVATSYRRLIDVKTTSCVCSVLLFEWQNAGIFVP